MTSVTLEIKKLWQVIGTGTSSIIELRALWPKGIEPKQPPSTKHFRAKDYSNMEVLKDAFEQEALRLNTAGYNIYAVMNPVTDSFHGRNATDADISFRDLLLIDIDKVGFPNQPSTDAEVEAARELADKVSEWLEQKSWGEPIRVMSGNGHHLYYVLKDMPNTPEVTASIKKLLQGLAKQFNNEVVKIDTSVYNASRITKVVGTIARKGPATEVRPHRMAVLYER